MTRVHEHLGDDELLRAHVHGDPDAFTELVRRHRDRLWAVAIRTLADREEAADAVQDALLSAYRAAGRFRGDSAVTTWLHRIVVNACLDRARRRQARPTVALPDTELGQLAQRTAAPAHDSDTALSVRGALAKLPPEQRIALVLLDMQGYSVAEIAAMLGIAEGTVKSRCARGRARLAVLLGHLRSGDDERPDKGNLVGDRHVGSTGAPTAPPGTRQVTRSAGSEPPRSGPSGAGPSSAGGGVRRAGE